MPLQPRLGSVNPNREPVFLPAGDLRADERPLHPATKAHQDIGVVVEATSGHEGAQVRTQCLDLTACQDRKSTRLNSSHSQISYAVFCLKKKRKKTDVKDTIAIGWHAVTNAED